MLAEFVYCYLLRPWPLRQLTNWTIRKLLPKSVRYGDATIVLKSIDSPLRILCDNAGVEGAIVAQEVLKSKGARGYNVATDEYQDLVAAGVVDPTKVTRTALQNAGSVAGLLLTTDCMITDLPEKDDPSAGGHGHDHGMGGMM